MTDEQMKTYKTKCEIEYSQEYLPSRDITLIFEDLFIWSKDVNEKPEKYAVRERICGFYHGDPTEEDMRHYMATGCEAIMEDELMTALTITHGEEPKDNGVTDEYAPKPGFTYSVVVYGGFDETPLIRYQRTYDDEDQALEVYHELEETFRLEHQIFDNNTGEFIDQEDCSSMALVKDGPYDARVVYFKSLVDNSNYEDYTEVFNLIVKYFQENNMLV